jgi:hypothetical protein
VHWGGFTYIMPKLVHVLSTTAAFMVASSSEVLLVKTMNNEFGVRAALQAYCRRKRSGLSGIWVLCFTGSTDLFHCVAAKQLLDDPTSCLVRVRSN